MLATAPVSPSKPLATSLSSSQSQGSNPLSIRLYKVLAANFDDDATRDALNTLSELYSLPPVHQSIPNGKRLQKGKGLSTRESDDDGDEEEHEVRNAALEFMVSLSEAKPVVVKRVDG